MGIFNAFKKGGEKTPESRKAQNIEKLKKLDVPYIDWLPMLDGKNEVRKRSVEEISRRAVACLIAILAALEQNNGNYENEREFLLGKLEAFGVTNDLTPKEKRVIDAQANEQEIINMVWKYESYWALVWALGFVDELNFPDTIVDGPTAIGIVAKFSNLDEFIAAAKLKDIDEILDEADLIYRYHWACVNARINNLPMPKKLDEGVVMERRAGLWWIVDMDKENDWDNVAMDT
ncbi:DUF4272 domain-containing protein [Campylobacter curvus]|uniref:DUF4272 domain-containing protein n=1 Tax=Campylobacter curvus TaxID=200 RepID=UPI0014702730|nr:DUF4272 domain-containing protein [Campylobacter curvus]